MVDRSDDQLRFADLDAGTPKGADLRSSPLGRFWRAWRVRRARRRASHRFTIFSSLTRRIVILNLAGLVALVTGILYLNQFREGLIDARVQSLLVQGEIIASAIVASASVEDDNTIIIDPERLLELQAGESLSVFDNTLESLEFPINPERVAPILRRLITPTGTRARIYDPEGGLIIDSQALYARGAILRFDLPIATTNQQPWWERLWQSVQLYIRRFDMPPYEEIGGANGMVLPEVRSAMAGNPASFVRVNERGEMVVSVAVPIQRFRANLGALLLSTQGGDIDAIIFNERMSILRVFLVSRCRDGDPVSAAGKHDCRPCPQALRRGRPGALFGQGARDAAKLCRTAR
jgi:two-component system sensor histidine kinase ChvG